MPTKLKKIGKPVKAAGDTHTPKVARVAPPADVKADAAPKAKATKEPKAAKPSRNISLNQHLGRHMRIAEYQDYTLYVNADKKCTDAELIALWQKEFPNAVKFTEHHVRGVRRDYNAGRHSKQFSGKKQGDDISVPYMLKDGKRLPATVEHAPATPAVAKASAAKDAKKSTAKSAAA